MRASSGRHQGGAIAIIVALSLVALVGFAGLVLDLGRLYVNRSELQSAADACALAAAAELVCDPAAAGACPGNDFTNARQAGQITALRNKRDFQGGGVSIADGDVRFALNIGPNSAYLAASQAPPAASKYAMCIAHSAGIVPWFMGVLGAGARTVSATAVATLAPSQNFCTLVPMGVCRKGSAGGPHYGYAVNEWIASDFNSGGSGEDLAGSFQWVDFTPAAGGSNEIRDQLAGTNQVCNVHIGDNVVQAGVHQGVKSAYNTRFGIYPNGANAYTPADAPPDNTGFAYPSKNPGGVALNQNAWPDFEAKRTANAPFDDSRYDVSGPGGNINGNPVGTQSLADWGRERRVVAVPAIDCSAGNTVPIIDMMCVLMLNPMSNGANGTIYLQYLGNASAPGSPCRTSGTPSSGGNGPQVPTLVQ